MARKWIEITKLKHQAEELEKKNGKELKIIYLFQTIIEQHTGDIEEIDISHQEIVDLIIVNEVEVELLFFVEHQTLRDQDEPYLHNKELGRRTLGNEPGLGCVGLLFFVERRTLRDKTNPDLECKEYGKGSGDAKLLEGELTLEERRTNYTNQTLVKGKWGRGSFAFIFFP
ncbi:hypothetical protein GLOIN_2v1798339 [Rhizophagus irregularis DAOM 181602=DAOM 197198]|nr:hypothetical protein GLOIN_2v1798339 [Rhizophagus irregularis DAOM 181602=DAOM 197198]